MNRSTFEQSEKRHQEENSFSREDDFGILIVVLRRYAENPADKMYIGFSWLAAALNFKPRNRHELLEFSSSAWYVLTHPWSFLPPDMESVSLFKVQVKQGRPCFYITVNRLVVDQLISRYPYCSLVKKRTPENVQIPTGEHHGKSGFAQAGKEHREAKSRSREEDMRILTVVLRRYARDPENADEIFLSFSWLAFSLNFAPRDFEDLLDFCSSVWYVLTHPRNLLPPDLAGVSLFDVKIRRGQPSFYITVNKPAADKLITRFPARFSADGQDAGKENSDSDRRSL